MEYQNNNIPAGTIEFSKKFSMRNGNKVTKSNWRNVIAVSLTPCTHVRGNKEIDKVLQAGEKYFETWKLVYEKDEEDQSNAGYIFREVNHGGGICGRHKTFKKAIWTAMNDRIKVFLLDKENS